jgi:hypothetical protein
MAETLIERPMPTGEGLTFDKGWAMFHETDKKFQKTERLLKETRKMVDRNGKQMGELHRKFGRLAEHLVAPGIEKRFNEMGFHFTETALKGMKVKDEKKRVVAQIDILLENNETAVLVEVKVKPEPEDIAEHIERMEIFRDIRKNGRGPRKRVLGGIAGAIFEDNMKAAVRKAGLYVIEQSGDTMKIDMPEGWEPKAW